jgi:SOS response associated peptidase (SRAP)
VGFQASRPGSLRHPSSDNVMSSNFWKDRFKKHRRSECQGRRDIIGFAGLWSPWKNSKTDQSEDTFSVFTTYPNAKMKRIHDRQPVILEPRDYEEGFHRQNGHLCIYSEYFPPRKPSCTWVNPVSVEPPCEPPGQGCLFG